MMNKYIKTAVGCVVCLLMTACDQFEYHPYSPHINGKTALHSEYIPKIEQKCKGRDVVRFAFVTDTQGHTDELEDAIRHMRKRTDIDFIIHGGDQSDFGLPKEFVWCRDLMEKSALPYVAVLGNHDCVGNGEQAFQYIYGEPNFSFNAGFVHFVCLNTVALEYDYSNPVPDLNYIEEDIKKVNEMNAGKDTITSTVIVMHARPGDDQFNNNVSRVFNYYLCKYPGATEECGADGALKRIFCVNGHNHCHDVKDLFGNGMMYYGCADISKRIYYVFTVTREGCEYEIVEY